MSEKPGRRILAGAAVVALALAVRWPFWREALRTPLDGDTSLVGLMALHPAQAGTTLWGQPYGSPLEAWLLAPVLAATGPSAEAVRVFYFVLGLLLVPAAALVARLLDRGIALHAAVLAAAPCAYMLLLGASPAAALPVDPADVRRAAGLGHGARAAPGARGAAARRSSALGLLAGLAVWTHLMAVGIAGAGLICLARWARPSAASWPCCWPASCSGRCRSGWVSTCTWPPASGPARGRSSTWRSCCRPCTSLWLGCSAPTRR